MPTPSGISIGFAAPKSKKPLGPSKPKKPLNAFARHDDDDDDGDDDDNHEDDHSGAVEDDSRAKQQQKLDRKSVV